ncbi:hypothetical protein BDV12DRAFT_176751 [Aspergillus spectabilis]
MLYSGMVTMMAEIAGLVACTPASYFWTQTMLDPAIQGVCHLDRLAAWWYLYSASVAVCDLTLAILPILIVRNLQMPEVTKIAVVAIVSLGTCMSSAFFLVAGWLLMEVSASAGTIVRAAYITALQQSDFCPSTLCFSQTFFYAISSYQEASRCGCGLPHLD